LYYLHGQVRKKPFHSIPSALEIQEKFLRPGKSSGAVRNLNRIAFLYKGLEKPEMAEEYFRKALKLLEHASGAGALITA